MEKRVRDEWGTLTRPQTRVNIGDKQRRGGGTKNQRPNNKAPRLETHVDHPMEMERNDGGTANLRWEPPHHTGLGHTEVIPKTQLNEVRKRSNIYNDIMASIGLDSPTSSRETREGVANVDINDQAPSVENTPIQSSAANLLALGKHVLTPRQGRIWDHRNKSPLVG